jgi:hypothetical protein
MTRLQIFVQGEGKRDIRVLDLSPLTTVRELMEAAQAQGVVASQNGARNADGNTIAVYAEDSDMPLPPDATLEAAGLGNQSSVHLSRCKQVTVTVNYNGKEHSEMFGPGVPMRRVKAWAVGKKGFNFTPVDAAEHILQLTGTVDRPDEDVHIGTLVGVTGCRVEFDLVAKVRVEG